MKSLLLILTLAVLLVFGTNAAFAQAVTTNSGSGLAPTYPNLAAAIVALNGVTITSPVVITLNGNETAPLGGYSITQLGGTQINPIIIQGISSTITAPALQTAGSQSDAIFKIIGGDWITIQDFTMMENFANANFVLATNDMTEFGVALYPASTIDGAQNNTIQNNTIILNYYYQNSIGIMSTSSSTAAHTAQDAVSIAGTNSYNKFYHNYINDVAYGIYMISPPMTATVFETGNDIGGISPVTGNTIVFGCVTQANFSNLNRFSAVLPAGIYFRNCGAGNNVSFNTVSSIPLVYPQSGGIGGIITTSSATPTGITYFTTFNNNGVTLTNSGTTAITGIDFGYGLSTGTIVGNNNEITLNQNNTAAVSAALTGIKANYTSATNTLIGNLVTVNQNPTVAGSVTSAVTGITGAGIGTTVNVNNNEITFKQNAPTGTATYGAGTIIYVDIGAGSGTVNVNSNQFLTTGSTIRSTGSCIGVNHNTGTITVGITINLNTITIDRIAASGTITGTNEGTAPSTVAHTITNNSITFTNLSGTAVAYGIMTLGGASATGTVKAINSNTINMSGTYNGTTIGIQTGYSYGNMNNNSVTISSASPTITGLQATSSSAGAYTMTGNTLSLISSATSPTAMTGINVGATGPFQIYGNTFSVLNFTGIITAAPTISVIAVGAGTGNNIYNNVITNVSVGTATSSASPVIRGIAITGGTSTNVYKNKIYGITTLANGTSTLVSGITISAGTTNTVYNNLIGDLTAPAATNTDAVRGINITSTTTSSSNNIYYNTVYLSATSSGTNFGSSGIFHTANATPTTATLNLRNNIIVNNSTATGTGLSVAYRRSGTALANYASTSNNNNFFAPTIMHDGTTAYTISTYKTLVAPRDAASFAENPTFISTSGASADFLHLSTSVGTQCESGAQNIAGITDDFDGVIRQGNTGYTGTGSAPDIGADEGEFVLLDLIAPNISYTPLLNTSSTIDRTLIVTVTDASGVPITNPGWPNLYWMKTGDVLWTAVEPASVAGSQYTYNFGAGVTTSDVVSYYIVAQDNATAPNIGAFPSGASGFTANPPAASTPPTTPSSYTIIGSISGTFSVGASQTYPTLTAAITDISGKEMTGAITLNLESDYSPVSETFPITIGVIPGASAANTLTIKPASGVITSITGSSASSIIKLNGADYVIIDGSNTALLYNKGTDRSLTISNTYSTAGSAAIWISSLGTGAGSRDVTVKNCNISAGSNASGYYGVFVGGSTLGTAGDDNDNCTIENNAISKAYYGIYAAANSTGVNDNLMIKQNSIGSDVTADQIGFVGIYIAQAASSAVTQNTVFNIIGTVTNPKGVQVAAGVTGSTFNRNKIYGIKYTGTSGYGGKGFDINTTVSSSNLTFANNMIYDISGDGYSGTSDNICGFRLAGGGGYNFYFNTVNLFGNISRSGATADISAGMFIISGVTNLDIRNNIFVNSLDNTTGVAKAYSIYTGTTNSAFSEINFNNYFASGLEGVLGYLNADQSTLSAWQIATTKDANSVSGDPKFILNTNLHIDPLQISPVSNAGFYLASVPTDIDGDTRLDPPDIGADEYTGILPAAFALLTPTNGATGVALNGSLTWETSTYADNYDVYLDKVDGTTLVSPNQTATIYDYVNLDANATYYWKVVAKNANGNTVATGAPWSFTTLALLPPNPPTDLVLSNITNDAMDLSWTDASSDETGFYINKSLNGTTFTQVDAVGADVTTYTGDASRTLGVNTRVWWRVTAYNGNSESGFAAANAFTLANTPGAPTLSEVAISTMKVTLNPASNPTSTEFVVRVVYGMTTKYMNTAGALVDAPVWGTYAGFGGASGKTATGLTTVTSYTFDVKARNGNNIETIFGASSTETTLPYPSALSEGFEGTTFPPSGWRQDIIVSGGTNWTRVTSGTSPTCLPYSGIAMARYNCYSAPSGSMSRLVTPVIGLPTGSQSHLNFYMYQDPGYSTALDSIYVQVSTDMGTTWTTITGFSRYAVAPGWVLRDVSLNAYANTNAEIGLLAVSKYGNNMFVDAVSIFEPPAKDIQVSSVSFSAGPYYVGLPITVNAVIQNNGTEINPGSVPLTYKIGSAPATQGDGVGETFIPSWTGNTATITFATTYTPSSTGNVEVFAKSFYPDDAVPANDVASKSVKVLPVGALFEDFTDVNALARWKIVNLDGGASTWRRATEKFLSAPASAGSDYEADARQNNDWLISPKLSVSAGDSLTFWHSIQSTSYPESLYVRLSTTGNNPENFTVELLKFRDNTTMWKYKAIDLNAYAGQNVYIAFVNRSTDMWTVYVDDISGPAVYVPAVDLAFISFYQSSGLPTPKSGELFTDYNISMNEKISEDGVKPLALLSDNVKGERASEEGRTVVVPDNGNISLDKKLTTVDIKAGIKNIGTNAAAYILDWNVSDVAQPTYTGPSVNPSETHLADLTFSPSTRGTFLTSGAITVASDENPDNNSRVFRMRIYPDEFQRTIYDRSDNIVDTWVGWGGAGTTAMKAGVRFTATDTRKLAGVDFICNTEAITTGAITVQVREAGLTQTAPGPVIYTKHYTALDYFAAGGDYITFPFDDDAPVVASGSDYWITIKFPVGILYPGGVHNTGFTTGRSFYEGSTDTTVWNALVITTERAWIMRSYDVTAPNTIAGMKFNDINGNGVKDQGELGLEGWYISLNGPKNETVQTGSDGSYFFGDLPDGDYLITEDNQVGWLQTAPQGGSYNVTVVGGQNLVDKDFGNFKLGSISGYKWNDLDGDGVWDEDEPTLAGWTINLTGPINGTTVTNENGWYQFTDLTVGTYTVAEVVQAVWIRTYPADPGTHSVDISSGSLVENKNFGNFKYGTVSGLKFWDRNNNGVKDLTEVGLEGWEIKLNGAVTGTRTTMTNSTGEYNFDNVVADNFTLTETVKPDWVQTASPTPFAIISGSVVTGKLFGNFYSPDAEMYRTFLPESLVAVDAKNKVPKAVKRKPVGGYWEFKIMYERQALMSVMNVQFKNDVREIISAEPFTTITGAKKDFKFEGAELLFGDSIIIKGYTLKGKPQAIKKIWFGPKTMTAVPGPLPYFEYLELPMPTWANMINETFSEGGFPEDGGLLVGQKGDPKKIGWVFIQKSSNVQKSLRDKTGPHTEGPSFFRKFANQKFFLKELKVLPPSKHNNKLFAEIVALKLAVAASELGKIPEGLGELVYIDDDPTWLNGKTVRDIVDDASVAMNSFEGDSLDYYTAIRKINEAFSGSIDSVEFGGGDGRTIFTGVRSLAEVPYLRAIPGMPITRIKPNLTPGAETPEVFELAQNYPNPFNPTTTIEFNLPQDALVSLKVYNMLGQEVATLADRELFTEGINDFEFDASRLSSGVYFYRIVAEGLDEDATSTFTQVKKMILMK